MYFWRISSLAKNLQYNVFDKKDYLLSLIFFGIFFISGFNVARFFYWAYILSMITIRNYLLSKTDPLPFSLTAFNSLDFIFLSIMVVLIVLGILYCLFFRAKKLTFLEKVRNLVMLSVPLTIRIITLLGLLYALFIGFFIFYFGWNLWVLDTQEATGICAKFFKPLVKANRWLPFTSMLWHQGTLYCKLQVLFQEMNDYSYYLYLLSHLFDMIATSWFFIRLREILRKIDAQEY